MKFNPKQKIYVLCETGALGDTIATFPTLKILSDRGHIEKMFVDERYLDLYRVVFPDHLIVRLKDAMTTIPRAQVTQDIPRSVINPQTGDACFLSYPIDPRIPVVHTMSQNGLTAIHASLVDGFSATITNSILKEWEKDYPRVVKSKLPDNPLPLNDRPYAVIAYGATTEHRKMLPEAFVGIRDFLIRNNYHVVLLGKRDHQLSVMGGGTLTAPSFEGIDTTGCVDLLDKTTVLEALSIMSDAKVVIGVDGGLIHLAGMTDTAIVAGFTTVDPYYRPIYRHGIKNWRMQLVEPTSECLYCQTNTFATYGINFHICNTGTKECMNSLTADSWIRRLVAAGL